MSPHTTQINPGEFGCEVFPWLWSSWLFPDAPTTCRGVLMEIVVGSVGVGGKTGVFGGEDRDCWVGETNRSAGKVNGGNLGPSWSIWEAERREKSRANGDCGEALVVPAKGITSKKREKRGGKLRCLTWSYAGLDGNSFAASCKVFWIEN